MRSWLIIPLVLILLVTPGRRVPNGYPGAAQAAAEPPPDDDEGQDNDQQRGPDLFDRIESGSAKLTLGVASREMAILSRARRIIQSKGLPLEGDVKFSAPKNWHVTEPLPRGPKKGYMDADGNEWVKSKGSEMQGVKHWDVQTPDGGHINVLPDGRIAH